MIKYTSTKQLSIEEFKTPFYYGLDKDNRWARLAQQIPWDEYAKIYSKALCEDFGRPALDARVVIGAMIIKYKKCLSDEETIEEISKIRSTEKKTPIFSISSGTKNSATSRLLIRHSS